MKAYKLKSNNLKFLIKKREKEKKRIVKKCPQEKCKHWAKYLDKKGHCFGSNIRCKLNESLEVMYEPRKLKG